MPYKAVLFDLDGTLLDTLYDLREAVNYVMRKYNQPEHSMEAVRSFVGNGVRNLMRKAVPGGEDNPTFEEQLALDIEYYRLHNRANTRPYKGVYDILDELREKWIKVAVISNKDEVAVNDLCDYYFEYRYDIALGNTSTRPRKPYPTIVYSAMERFVASKKDVLYVGDSETDAATAENAGVDYVLVSWGFRDRKTLEQFNAKAVIDTPEELMPIVLAR